MALCRLVYLLVVAYSLNVVSSEPVPVFLWGDLQSKSLRANPLSEVSEEVFSNILKQQLKAEPFTVVIIEENLSVEDFSRKTDGDTSYPYLHAQIGDALYIPSVQSSLAVIDSLAEPDKVDHVTLTENGLSAEIEPEGGKYLFINLKDARVGESRSEMLRRHNNFMQDMFSKLQERYERVVGIYTARNPSWTVSESHRVRRQAPASNNNPVIWFGGEALLYVKNVTLNGALLEGATGTATRNDTSGDIIATLTYPSNVITMFFSRSRGYWFLNRVDVQVDEGTSQRTETVESNEVYAQLGFSYRCGQDVMFANGNDTRPMVLTLEDMQVQPFYLPNSTVFGDAYYCVGFTSVPIWAGLFVTFILLLIMFYGIMNMMDIRTMDRFDDPKGKTITINAME